MAKTQYIVNVAWPNGTVSSASFIERSDAVAYQIICIKQGATATISNL
jgi:hypothetical protein